MRLLRVANTDKATFGVLISSGVPFAVTLELPWVDDNGDGFGDTNKSRIPAGTYTCKRFTSEKHPRTFQIMNVPGRNAILFHTANRVRDLRGCVGVAEKFEPLDGEDAVQESKQAFDEFLRITEGFDEFELEVIDAPTT